MSDAKIGFESQKITLSLDVILPVREIEDAQKNIGRYQAILASVKEVGQMEPLMVHPQADISGRHELLDGHLRYFALKEMGHASADCIFANRDDDFDRNLNKAL